MKSREDYIYYKQRKGKYVDHNQDKDHDENYLLEWYLHGIEDQKEFIDVD